MYFNSNCLQVKLAQEISLNVSFEGNMSNGDPIEFYIKHLLVDGSELDSAVTPQNPRCYIGIFPDSRNTHYFGALYLVRYYTFFDAGGPEEAPVIGTGLRKTKIHYLQSLYNVSAPDYSAEPHSVDAMDLSDWTYYPNPFTEPLDNMKDVTVFWAWFGGLVGLILLAFCAYRIRLKY